MTATTRYSLIYGLIAGLVLIAFITVIGLLHDKVDFVATMTFGFAVMLVALSFVFVGVKRYRDIEQGGVIRFGKAFALGLAIALIAALIYVLAWEAYLAITDYRFMEDYAARSLADAREAGKSATDLAAMRAEFDKLIVQYDNPAYRMPMTFVEIAPVGLIVALVSAALLRNPRLLPAR
ncbi:DUF4199 domain-containing protein [Sphingomonas mesophila]|uniref:DUF4199 domain-containing protein n=1 Tax=Sphingomonas mesophila TaxID=2303576 RepID=UPI000E569F7E|nr:DUF4199 domain-containing protein [Sphingomonas mesophila]